MPVITVPTFAQNQKVSATFTYFNTNGQLDTTTPMTLSSDTPAIATVAIDTGDLRKLWISGAGQGTTTVRANAPVAPGTGGQLQYTVTVDPPANLSHIDHVSFEAPVPQ